VTTVSQAWLNRPVCRLVLKVARKEGYQLDGQASYYSTNSVKAWKKQQMHYCCQNNKT